ncbi:MAG: polyprenyl synthetase family protein [Candidatus Hodarchaeales archaeon]|jgi:geranylgeranyl diphosphate synthase type II
MQEQSAAGKLSPKEQARLMKGRMDKLMDKKLIEELTIRLKTTIAKMPYPLNDRVADFVVGNAGKMLRPMLLVMTARLLGAKGKTLELAKDSGIAVELLHTMTLMHDDILDGAPLRRSRPSYHRLHGVDKAIHDGDVLHAFALTLVDDSRCIELMLDIAYQVSKGSFYELEPRFDTNFDLSENYIINVLRLKTAIVFYGCVKVSCMITNREDLGKKLKETIMNAGIAFQLQDDILDIIGEQEKFGKEAYWDIQESKRNMFLHYALQEPEYDMIMEIYGKPIGEKTKEDIEFVLDVFRRQTVLGRVLKLRDEYLDSCIAGLDKLMAESNDTDYPFFDYLKDLILYLCTRDK